MLKCNCYLCSRCFTATSVISLQFVETNYSMSAASNVAAFQQLLTPSALCIELCIRHSQSSLATARSQSSDANTCLSINSGETWCDCHVTKIRAELVTEDSKIGDSNHICTLNCSEALQQHRWQAPALFILHNLSYPAAQSRGHSMSTAKYQHSSVPRTCQSISKQ